MDITYMLLQTSQRVARLVVVKALSALLTQPTRINHPLEQPRRPILAVSGFLMQYIHNSQAGIKTNKVSQGQRSHGNICSILHDAVNVLAGTNSSLQADDSLIDVWHEDTVSEETRRIR